MSKTAITLVLLALVGVGINFVGPPLRQNPASANPETQSIELCFAPGGECAAVITREIGYAERQVLVHAYVFTSGSIATALIQAKRRGVEVEIIGDRSMPCTTHTQAPVLQGMGIPIAIDADAFLAHEKAMMVDGKTTIMGDYNWTRAAAHESAVLMVIRSPEVTARFVGHWQERRATATPIEKKTWCIRGDREAAQ